MFFLKEIKIKLLYLLKIYVQIFFFEKMLKLNLKLKLKKENRLDIIKIYIRVVCLNIYDEKSIFQLYIKNE